MWGVFAQRGHSANYHVVYPGNTPENHPPTEGRMISSKQHRGTQNSGPWDPWLPVVENSRLFAQRVHSARCAPYDSRESHECTGQGVDKAWHTCLR